jgi:hypothetical protein
VPMSSLLAVKQISSFLARPCLRTSAATILPLCVLGGTAAHEDSADAEKGSDVQ